MRLIHKLNQSVTVVGSGIEALEVIERTRPNVAFLDLQMPGMTDLKWPARFAAEWN